MLNDIHDMLALCISEPPDDLVALYSMPRPIAPHLGINVLSLDAAAKYTRAIHEHTLLGRPMGLFALDDANDSNPFCYVSRGPAKGCILHLYHDGTTSIEYASLRGFVDALHAAIVDGIYIDDLPNKNCRPEIDQNILGNRIVELAGIGTDEAECELIILVSLLDTARTSTINLLSKHENFFVREETANLIANYPNSLLIEAAEILAGDIHPQVARPGKAALSAVRRVANISN